MISVQYVNDAGEKHSIKWERKISEEPEEELKINEAGEVVYPLGPPRIEIKEEPTNKPSAPPNEINNISKVLDYLFPNLTMFNGIFDRIMHKFVEDDAEEDHGGNADGRDHGADADGRDHGADRAERGGGGNARKKVPHTYIVKGEFQCGKSDFMIGESLKFLIKRRTSVFLVIQNNTDAYIQLENRIKGRIKEVYSCVKDFNIEDKFVYLDTQRGKCLSKKKLRNAMNGKEPKIFICMRSVCDISPIEKLLSTCSKKRYVLMIDEADSNDCNTTAKSLVPLKSLKDSATLVFNVTATPLTKLVIEDVLAENVLTLPLPMEYKGIYNFNFHPLSLPARPCSSKNHNPFALDLNLESYIKGFSRTMPYATQPAISLVYIGKVVNPLRSIATYVQERYKNDIITINYNGGGYGVELRGVALGNDPIVLPRSGKTSSVKEGVHRVCGVHIGEILEYLQNMGVARVPRVMILSGKLADRGISFVSTKEGRTRWHLTEMYLIGTKNMNQPNLLQLAGRLCGIYYDNIPLSMFSNVGEQIISANTLQNELIERAKMMNACSVMKELLQSINISKTKVKSARGKGHKLTHNTVKKMRLNTVKDDRDDGGYDWKAEGLEYTPVEIELEKGQRRMTPKRMFTMEERTEIRKRVKIDRERYMEENGKLIYTIDPDDLLFSDAKTKIISEVIDQIGVVDKWMPRASIINNLVRTKGYLANSIRADLTRIKQSVVVGKTKVGYGLNFRKDTETNEVYLLYHA